MRALALLALLLAASPAAAIQANFSLAPPPLLSPFLEPGRREFRLSGGFAGLSGDGLDVSGPGAALLVRRARDERWAWSFMGGVNSLKGSLDFTDPPLGVGATQGDLYFLQIPLQLNLECQAGGLVFFAGPSLNVLIGGMSGESASLKLGYFLNSWLFGAQAGVQTSWRLGDWRLAPFASLAGQRGYSQIWDNAEAKTLGAAGAGTHFEREGIPLTTIASGGLGLAYLPKGLSLTGLFQSAGAAGRNERFEAVSVLLGWHWAD